MAGDTRQKPEGRQSLAVRGLQKSFGRQKVLDGIDLVADRGETVVVLGRSGTGKSVLLKLILGLQKPDSGTICINDEDVTQLGMDRLNEVRKHVGFLFQQGALYDSMTVVENVEFPLNRHSQLSSSERRQRARDLLSSVGLEEDFSKMPSEISGGMQKRVGLARALALDPEILLLDEPTTGLDPITATEIGHLVRKLKEERKLTSIVVTHDVRGARIFADRWVLLREGKVLIEGTISQLEQSRDPFVVQFLKEAA
jgi:phospholipid/cholesterol/gamma-HCH transport system ATP-binding protein